MKMFSRRSQNLLMEVLLKCYGTGCNVLMLQDISDLVVR